MKFKLKLNIKIVYNLIGSLSVTGDRKIKAYLLNIAILFKRR